MSEIKIISARVTPKAKREGINEISDDRLEVSVREPAMDGRANIRVCELISYYYEVEPKKVIILRGHKTPTKLIKVFIS